MSIGVWLIPAHAGKTLCLDVLTHPPKGSSPLTRGKPELDGHSVWRVGLIPAHAGKTMRPSGTRSAQRAHPRSRGENVGQVRRTGQLRGSSPLTRGKLEGAWGNLEAAGLIPVHAGKTPQRQTRSAAGRAHPRSRGENVDSSIAALNEAGSSPLTRGKLRGAVAHLPRLGLIPAHAGKTP